MIVVAEIEADDWVRDQIGPPIVNEQIETFELIEVVAASIVMRREICFRPVFKVADIVNGTASRKKSIFFIFSSLRVMVMVI